MHATGRPDSHVLLRKALQSDSQTTRPNYDYVSEKIGDGPFDGLIAHAADDDEEVFRIFDFWGARQAQCFHVNISHSSMRASRLESDNFFPPTKDGFAGCTR
jgi:hypothetical protein